MQIKLKLNPKLLRWKRYKANYRNIQSMVQVTQVNASTECNVPLNT